MHHKHQDSQDNSVYNFPGLKKEVRRYAANDNSIPMLGTIMKHIALMTGAFTLLYTLQIALF